MADSDATAIGSKQALLFVVPASALITAAVTATHYFFAEISYILIFLGYHFKYSAGIILVTASIVIVFLLILNAYSEKAELNKKIYRYIPIFHWFNIHVPIISLIIISSSIIGVVIVYKFNDFGRPNEFTIEIITDSPQSALLAELQESIRSLSASTRIAPARTTHTYSESDLNHQLERVSGSAADIVIIDHRSFATLIDNGRSRLRPNRHTIYFTTAALTAEQRRQVPDVLALQPDIVTRIGALIRLLNDREINLTTVVVSGTPYGNAVREFLRRALGSFQDSGIRTDFIAEELAITSSSLCQQMRSGEICTAVFLDPYVSNSTLEISRTRHADTFHIDYRIGTEFLDGLILSPDGNIEVTYQAPNSVAVIAAFIRAHADLGRPLRALETIDRAQLMLLNDEFVRFTGDNATIYKTLKGDVS